MSANRIEESILRRLDILIFLALEQGESASMSLTEKIGRLSASGLSAAEIGSILRKPTNYVTAVLSQKKQKHKKRAKADG